MNIYVDQGLSNDYFGTLLTQGLIECEHTVYNAHGGLQYNGEVIDFIITTDTSSGSFLPPALVIHIGNKPNPLNITSIHHEDPGSLFGIFNQYYAYSNQTKISLLKRCFDVCVLSGEDNIYYQTLVSKFSYNNIIRIEEPGRKNDAKDIGNSKIVVVPKTDVSYSHSIWRAMASGALIMVEDLTSYQTFPPINNKHAISFTDEKRFIDELEHGLNYPLQHQHVADAAWNTGKRYHTSKIRGRQLITYVLTKARMLMQIPQQYSK